MTYHDKAMNLMLSEIVAGPISE